MTVSTKCGNAHIYAGIGSGGDSQGDMLVSILDLFP